MMRQFELVERVKAYDPRADEDLLNRAYVFGIAKHGNQKRQSGDPYFSHPLEVAGILTDLKADEATVVTALLHDTLEDTDTTIDELTVQFGKEIADLVNGVTKLSQFELQSEQTKQAENFRKFMMAMAGDVRVLLVKLADRLHNMRTLQFMKEEKRRRIAQETLDIYAPLAGRTGMQTIREELEDLAFQTLNSEARDSIIQRLKTLKAAAGDKIEAIQQSVKRKLAEQGIDAQVSGREKKPYSIWRKMEESKISFEALSDIYGFRVIVPSIDACYRALGIVHQNWQHIPGRFKDYISIPKSNNYRSLHTTVIGPENQRVELQFRTASMHEIAEHGIAAHWSYKENGGGAPAASVAAYENLRTLIDSLQHGDTPEEFLEHTKLELFQDQVFCFSPKGMLIALPRGATPIDFAYAVHTTVGDTCVGAKINGRHMPLSTQLKNGDQVEVIRSPKQGPTAAWEQIVVTGKARSAIRRYIRNQQRVEHVRMGRAILERAVADTGHQFSERGLSGALKKLKLAKPEDVYAALGEGVVTASQVLEAIFPDYRSKGAQAPSRGPSKQTSQAIPIQGLMPGLAYQIAPCCQPLPGDRIVGIVTPGQGVNVHTIDCQQLEQFHDMTDRWLDLSWDKATSDDQLRVGRIRIAMPNEMGALANACQVIARHEGNISNLKITQRTQLMFEMEVDVEVRDARHMTNIVTGLRASPMVANADRVRG
ncbi:MAG TPA: bifunctional (p)ppGpp synthetase/guanosine-3',5'-bis(diphosphate) 3'-pyrophosphohydrolase [Alphaproteobacteria bacterium]|nr:bifunctional (p)ppGpp synthetase/guanosine-3',5'-bis(diphosphate) 3'-pyrophosphohydrolase [Alphaproteobacteria bacterium]